jgi:hypothetical protein
MPHDAPPHWTCRIKVSLSIFEEGSAALAGWTQSCKIIEFLTDGDSLTKSILRVITANEDGER